MKIQFTKMSGAGNDFVVIDNRIGLVRDGERLAKIVCDRRWGVGADGLLLLERTEIADFRMMYYNADGSYGGMCGNGGRCISRFAVENGIAKSSHSFEALGYVYKSEVGRDKVLLSMKNPVNIRKNIVLRLGALRLKVHFIDTGSPHVVIPIAQMSARFKALEDIPVEQLGRKVRFHKLFSPDGTNVNFVYKNKDNSIRMRTYERGVEAETLACGTGSVACALIGSAIWKIHSPVKIIPLSGVELEVSFSVAYNAFSNVSLKGEAIATFQGEIDVD
jgi:diaminopimelate epimerase